MSRASLPRYIRMFLLLENVYSMKSQSFNQQLTIAIFADDGHTDERIDQWVNWTAKYQLLTILNKSFKLQK